jgi:hypothetical protein
MFDNDGRETLKLKLQRESREIDVEVAGEETLIDILRGAGIPIDGVLVFKQGIPLSLDSKVNGLGIVTVLNVSSGG